MQEGHQEAKLGKYFPNLATKRQNNRTTMTVQWCHLVGKVKTCAI